MSKFMAFVHTSVNQTSQSYLNNEQCYNYTTPKSFLEFIRLYQSLLHKNGKELKSKMERLENGLLKLRSTSAQVVTSFPISSAWGAERRWEQPLLRELEGSHFRSKNHLWFSRGTRIIRNSAKS